MPQALAPVAMAFCKCGMTVVQGPYIQVSFNVQVRIYIWMIIQKFFLFVLHDLVCHSGSLLNGVRVHIGTRLFLFSRRMIGSLFSMLKSAAVLAIEPHYYNYTF